MRLLLKLFLGLFLLISCRKKSADPLMSQENEVAIEIKYAQYFKIFKTKNYTRLSVLNNKNTTDFYFIHKDFANKQHLYKELDDTNTLRVPLSNIVVTSTTDIPFLEALGVENRLIGFPEPNYISSKKTRQLIDKGAIKNIGNAANLNNEVLLELKPEAIVGFSLSDDNKKYDVLERSGIPTIMNSSWLENHPLGRAEWIKVFGLLFNKEKEANDYFTTIENSYNKGIKLAQKASKKPTILSGNMYKDVWYVPGGKSYMAQLIEDANGNYLWKENTKTASLALSFESVYDKASNADIWIGGGNFNTIKELKNFEDKYGLFKATQNNNVFSKDIKKGPTGGTLYYEQGSLHADWILLDLIKIFHPNLAGYYSFHFYQKLD